MEFCALAFWSIKKEKTLHHECGAKNKTGTGPALWLFYFSSIIKIQIANAIINIVNMFTPPVMLFLKSYQRSYIMLASYRRHCHYLIAYHIRQTLLYLPALF